MVEPHPDAHLDPAPGTPGAPDAGPPAPAAPLWLDTPHGPAALGAPGVDSDVDGRPDTVAATGVDGLLLATDLDADGHVDVATVVGPDGTARTTARTPDGRIDTVAWATEPPVWDPGWDAPPPPAPALDPATGTWTRTP